MDNSEQNGDKPQLHPVAGWDQEAGSAIGWGKAQDDIKEEEMTARRSKKHMPLPPAPALMPTI